MTEEKPTIKPLEINAQPKEVKRPKLTSIKQKIESLHKKEEERSENEKFFSNKQQRVARGRMIKYLRTEKKISRQDFCEMVGMSSPYLSEVENGARDMNMAHLDHWLEILGGRMIIIPFDKI